MSAPYRCPVCNGRGKVPLGFYDYCSTNTAEPICRTCNGTGIVWPPPESTWIGEYRQPETTGDVPVTK